MYDYKYHRHQQTFRHCIKKKTHIIINDHYKSYPCDLPDCFQMFEDFHWICCV